MGVNETFFWLGAGSISSGFSKGGVVNFHSLDSLLVNSFPFELTGTTYQQYVKPLNSLSLGMVYVITCSLLSLLFLLSLISLLLSLFCSVLGFTVSNN